MVGIGVMVWVMTYMMGWEVGGAGFCLYMGVLEVTSYPHVWGYRRWGYVGAMLGWEVTDVHNYPFPSLITFSPSDNYP